MTFFNYFSQINKSDIKNIPMTDLTSSAVKNGLQIVFGLAGAIAIIMIIIFSIQYTVSVGDPQATGKFRNAIIYAAVGLAVCSVAFSIVTFVVGSI